MSDAKRPLSIAAYRNAYRNERKSATTLCPLCLAELGETGEPIEVEMPIGGTVIARAHAFCYREWSLFDRALNR